MVPSVSRLVMNDVKTCAPFSYVIFAPAAIWHTSSRLESSVRAGENKKNRMPCSMYQSRICDRIEKGGLSTTVQPSGYSAL